MRVAARLFWALLALLHARVRAGLLPSEFTPAEWLGTLLLVLVTAFFVLKAADVPFLRFGAQRRSILVFCLATAIVHHDAIAPESADISVLPAIASVVGTASIFEAARRAKRLLRAWHHLPGVFVPLFAHLRAVAWLPFASGWCWRHAPIPARAAPRAPPR